ncbi:septum formation initiator family protein [Patescibacteria group bacterium]|nr:septum formation initiator family protein [Patescibacteria group bacterium]MBU4512986.1 septum formation initiator family protein [Patescibacteria group bacterium]MCG2693023.1 septum formation initiator family protein [Candidatus Parcubacteria bacterium]
MRGTPGSTLKTILASKLFLFASLIFLILASLTLVRVVTRKMEVNREIAELENKINELEGRNIELTYLIDYLHTDTFEEESARLQLGLKKPGEEVVIISSPAATSLEMIQIQESMNDTSEPEVEEPYNPIKWWRYFFGTEAR